MDYDVLLEICSMPNLVSKIKRHFDITFPSKINSNWFKMAPSLTKLMMLAQRVINAILR